MAFHLFVVVLILGNTIEAGGETFNVESQEIFLNNFGPIHRPKLLRDMVLILCLVCSAKRTRANSILRGLEAPPQHHVPVETFTSYKLLSARKMV